MAFKELVRNQAQHSKIDELANTMMMTMHRWVGYIALGIGILLPLATYFLTSCDEVQESISHYYYTVAGPVFVGLLWATGFFLICYPGNADYEDYLTNVAGVLIILVACFPTAFEQQDTTCAEIMLCYDDWVSWLHLSCAGLFFVILGAVSIWLFPRPDPRDQETPAKRRFRNRLYRVAGVALWLGLIALAPMLVSEEIRSAYGKYKVVFWVEVYMLFVFGWVWLYKGRVVAAWR